MVILFQSGCKKKCPNKGHKNLALKKVNYNTVLGDATLVYFQILRNFKNTCVFVCISERQLNLTENKLNLTENKLNLTEN